MSHPVAIITGAGRGIGRATAVELAGHGYRLALIARSAGEIAETARLCGEGAMPMTCDVCDMEAVAAVVKETAGKFGRVDALVHNAGVAPLRAIDEMTIEQWRATIDTNLSAGFYFCRALWPIWRGQKSGTAVLVSSAAARDPFPGFAAYGAAKAGINTFGLALAKEGFPIGVRVHIVAPAATETAMFRALLTPEQYPAEKTLDPADVGHVIAQCVRGDLRHTSGEVIYVHKTV